MSRIASLCILEMTEIYNHHMRDAFLSGALEKVGIPAQTGDRRREICFIFMSLHELKRAMPAYDVLMPGTATYVAQRGLTLDDLSLKIPGAKKSDLRRRMMIDMKDAFRWAPIKKPGGGRPPLVYWIDDHVSRAILEVHNRALERAGFLEPILVSRFNQLTLRKA